MTEERAIKAAFGDQHSIVRQCNLQKAGDDEGWKTSPCRHGWSDVRLTYLNQMALNFCRNDISAGGLNVLTFLSALTLTPLLFMPLQAHMPVC